jgi:hypothetical protein
MPTRLFQGLLALLVVLAVAGAMPAIAQISTAIIDANRTALQQQSTDPVIRREGGTQPIDWNYSLPDGVTTRQVTFSVDGGTPLYGKLFFPKGFTAEGRYAAVAVGHGINALSIGIEKYAARFAERGLVAMAIDYRTYGWSGSDLRLLDADPTTDDTTAGQHVLRVQAKRTNLNNFREVEDFRAAVSYLQGEPGIDPERIGVWGSSNGGSVVVMVAAVDARVKAVVAQVSAVGGIGAKGPVPMRPEHVEDAILRARTGQGAEADGGFSFRSKIDLWGTIINREFRPGSMLDRVPKTTKLLWLPAEKDELIPLGGPSSGLNGPKAFAGTAQATVLPYISHFQAYSYTAFEVGSTLAADWFVKYLVDAVPPATPAGPEPPAVVPTVRGGAASASTALPGGVTTRDITFFSEDVRCAGRLYLPAGFTAGAAARAVVLAPGWGQTATSMAPAAAQLAARGIVALAIDYRGWGRSGGFVFPVTPIQTDDRLRFSQHTATVRIQRKRLVPSHQIMDIRNAVSWLQGEPGVDRARIAVWGTDLAAGHAVMVAATDPRVAAIVAQSPVVPGSTVTPAAWAPPTSMLRDEIARVRQQLKGSPDQLNTLESRAALAQYHPFHYLDHIPKALPMLIVAPDTAEVRTLRARLAGPTDVAADVAAAADWLRGLR